MIILTDTTCLYGNKESVIGGGVYFSWYKCDFMKISMWEITCCVNPLDLFLLSASLSLSPLTLSLFFFHLCDFLLYPSAFIFFILLLSAPSCGWSWVNETVGAHSLQHNETWSTHIHSDATTCWGTSMHTPRTKSSGRCSQLFQV